VIFISGSRFPKSANPTPAAIVHGEPDVGVYSDGDGFALTQPLRVALFSDSFHEANGVATLSREFARFAQRQELPFLCVQSGPQTLVTRDGSLTTVELERSRAAFALDRDLYCDPLLSRYKNWVTAQLRAFQADLVHITGPGDMGILGFWVAHSLRIPLVASWHTNLHEYAACRMDKLLTFIAEPWRRRISSMVEDRSLRACIGFYRSARFLLAPNQTLVDLLEGRTGRPTFLMAHGVDTDVYSPARRRQRTGSFCIGYVGRLTPEKNVRVLAELEQSLIAAGEHNFRFVVVGEGSEREWLRKHLQFGEFPGILRGEALAEAFASMDVLVFPSRTDTFGLVLLEAFASGVPVVVSPETGARVGVQHGVTGFHASDVTSVTQSVLRLMKNNPLHDAMSCAAREFACSKTWSGVFEQLYPIYQAGLKKPVSQDGGNNVHEHASKKRPGWPAP
jgi:glycosyltransferase involved in cell wall biosynthesis